MGVMFFSKCWKFYVDFENAIKFAKKVFGFLDNCIRVGGGKFFILWRKNLSSVINVLTKSPKISDLTEREVFELSLSQSDERIE